MSDTLKPEGSLPFVMKYKSVISFSTQWIKMPQLEVLQIRVIIDLHPKTFGRGSTDLQPRVQDKQWQKIYGWDTTLYINAPHND